MPRPSWVRPADAHRPRPVRVGAVTVTPVVQFRYRVDPALFFPDLVLDGLDGLDGLDDWYLRPPYCDDGFLVVDIGAFVVRTPDRTVLVDAGVGDAKTRPNPCFDGRADGWLDRLGRAGAAPEQVDAVVFTHLHVDHVGAAIRPGAAEPAFPAARYVTTRAELDHWTGPRSAGDRARLGDYLADSVLPLRAAGVLDVVSPDHELCAEVRRLPAPGHTPGNVCVEVRSEGERAVFAGDVVHHALQLARPALSTDFCVENARATASREALLRDIADTETLLFPAHFPEAAPGRVVTDPLGGYRYVPIGPAS
ncbi:MBL fold metallo-hydrolase [Pseudonocardia xishanensis]|uniref:Metallo-beta-lactamase domain-containing protein n=1 Tax=Pseudonocardia xishanensis TaxID=630995 RepID=A0ABP8S282_9PSEU